MKELNYNDLSVLEKFQVDFTREAFKDTVCNGKLVKERVFDKWIDYLLDTEAICRVSGWRTISEDGEWLELEYHLMKIGYSNPDVRTNLGEFELLEDEKGDKEPWQEDESES